MRLNSPLHKEVALGKRRHRNMDTISKAVYYYNPITFTGLKPFFIFWTLVHMQRYGDFIIR